MWSKLVMSCCLNSQIKLGIWALKVHCVVLGKKFCSEEKNLQWLTFLMPKQTKWTNSLCLHDWIQTDVKAQHCFIPLFTCGGPCHHLQTVFLGPYCPLKTSCFVSYGKTKSFWVCIITSLYSSPKLHSAPLKWCQSLLAFPNLFFFFFFFLSFCLLIQVVLQ